MLDILCAEARSVLLRCLWLNSWYHDNSVWAEPASLLRTLSNINIDSGANKIQNLLKSAALCSGFSETICSSHNLVCMEDWTSQIIHWLLPELTAQSEQHQLTGLETPVDQTQYQWSGLTQQLEWEVSADQVNHEMTTSVMSWSLVMMMTAWWSCSQSRNIPGVTTQCLVLHWRVSDAWFLVSRSVHD